MFGAIAAVAGGIIGGGFLDRGRTARRREARARRAQTIMARQQLRQQTLGQVRQMQMARAQGIQQAASTGTQDSSGLGGFLGGVGSTTASNISFARASFNMQEQIGQIQRRAQQARSQQGMYGQALQIGSQLLGGFGGGAPAPNAGVGFGAAQGLNAGTQAAQTTVGIGGSAGFGTFGG